MFVICNFIFPSWSNNKFLEMSIDSVIDICDKYILFINQESRSGLQARKEDIDKIIDLSNNYNKVFLEFIEKDPDNKDTKGLHEEIYVKKAFELIPDAEIILMVQSDEIYDYENIEKIRNLLYSKSFPSVVRFWSRTYYNTPNWIAVKEKYPSRRLWRRGFDKEGNEYIPFSSNIELGKDETVQDIFFHHPAYVLTNEELDFKLNNSSHAIKKQINPFFREKFDRLKIDKSLVHLHPVNPQEINHVEFCEDEIHEKMMEIWFDHLIENNPYNNFKSIFDDTKSYLMKEIERQMLSGIVAEMLPQNSKILEIGTWQGCSAINVALSNPTCRIYTIDSYKLDWDMRIWKERTDDLDSYYFKALNHLNQQNLYPHRVSILKGSVKQIVQHLPNNYFDLILLDGSHSYSATKEALIETWPKIKNYGFYLWHDTLLEEVSAVWDNYIQETFVECPWGLEKFDFYEIYKNIIPDKFKTSGLGIARVKK